MFMIVFDLSALRICLQKSTTTITTEIQITW